MYVHCYTTAIYIIQKEPTQSVPVQSSVVQPVNNNSDSNHSFTSTQKYATGSQVSVINS